jgi:hypothetical protein
LDELKADLVRACTRTSGKPLLDEVTMLVAELEEKAEGQGMGQSSSLTGILAGEWYGFFCFSQVIEVCLFLIRNVSLKYYYFPSDIAPLGSYCIPQKT